MIDNDGDMVDMDKRKEVNVESCRNVRTYDRVNVVGVISKVRRRWDGSRSGKKCSGR